MSSTAHSGEGLWFQSQVSSVIVVFASFARRFFFLSECITTLLVIHYVALKRIMTYRRLT
jgi:hypothetical protein